MIRQQQLNRLRNTNLKNNVPDQLKSDNMNRLNNTRLPNNAEDTDQIEEELGQGETPNTELEPNDSMGVEPTEPTNEPTDE
jgi:hypothetical protein